MKFILAMLLVLGAPKPEPASSPVAPAPAVGGLQWVKSAPAAVEFTKSEVTVAQYQACIDAGTCKPQDSATFAQKKNCNRGSKDRPDHPMNCVTWQGAEAFCKWAGGRLPTEEEWYSEASDAGKRKYPWGEQEPTCDLAIWGDGKKPDGCGKKGTWPVCSKPAGNSVSGLCDLSGNVWEWTSSGEAASRVMRGGSWAHRDPANLRTLSRTKVDPNNMVDRFGFRCSR